MSHSSSLFPLPVTERETADACVSRHGTHINNFDLWVDWDVAEK